MVVIDSQQVACDGLVVLAFGIGHQCGRQRPGGVGGQDRRLQPAGGGLTALALGIDTGSAVDGLTLRAPTRPEAACWCWVAHSDQPSRCGAVPAPGGGT